MKKLIAMLSVLAMLVALFTVPTMAEEGPIRIGTIYAMSGGNAAIGENILRGIDFAVAEINAKGGVNGRQLEVSFAATMPATPQPAAPRPSA